MSSPHTATRESPCATTKTQHSKKKTNPRFTPLTPSKAVSPPGPLCCVRGPCMVRFTHSDLKRRTQDGHGPSNSPDHLCQISEVRAFPSPDSSGRFSCLSFPSWRFSPSLTSSCLCVSSTRAGYLPTCPNNQASTQRGHDHCS